MLFALLSSFFVSLGDVFGKKVLQEIDEYTTAFSLRIFAFSILFFFMLFSNVQVTFDFSFTFLGALFVGGTLNVLAAIFYMRAIKDSDLSVSIPMLSFTPLFLLFLSPLILGEWPTWFGVMGVSFIVTGAYFLNIRQSRKGWLEPFRVLLREQGSRLMLLVAFIWSLTSTLDKVGVVATSPLVWALSINLYIILFMLPFVMVRLRKNAPLLLKKWKYLSAVGTSDGVGILFQMMAVQVTQVPYVIALKRMSILWSSLLGFSVFKEKDVLEKSAGIVCMLVGVLCIVLFS